MMRLIVYPVEYAILAAMDDAFCKEMGKELTDFHAREEERRRLEAEAAANKSKRRGR